MSGGALDALDESTEHGIGTAAYVLGLDNEDNDMLGGRKFNADEVLPHLSDHGSYQLNPEGDEYLLTPSDPNGEGKVDAKGFPRGRRKV